MPDQDDAGQRSCARGEWCADASIVTDERGQNPVRKPALCYRTFCDRCRTRIERDLEELPGLYVDLAIEALSPSRCSTQQIRIPFGPRCPISLDIDALMRGFEEILCSWHERVADIARLTFPERSRQRRHGFAVGQAITILGPHLDALLALTPEPMTRTYPLGDLYKLRPGAGGIVHSVYIDAIEDLSGAEAGLEILNLKYLARASLGMTKAKPEELVGVPCRECDQKTLARLPAPVNDRDPRWWSECLNCKARLDEDEYRDWTRLCAAYARGMRVVPTLENLPGAA
jgi:hypothetical protein